MTKIKTTNKGIDYASYHPKGEVDGENAAIMNPIHLPTLPDDDAYLRNKYTDAVLTAMRMLYDNWTIGQTNSLHLDGKQLNDYKFKDEEYNFYLAERIPDYKRISSLMYDKLVVQVYMKPKNATEYIHVAVVHLYYYSGFRYVRRYTNLFTLDDDRELVDPTHYNEWLYDTYKREVDISEDDLTSAIELEQLRKIGHVQLHYANQQDSDGTLIKTY